MPLKKKIVFLLIVLFAAGGMYDSTYLLKLHFEDKDHARTAREKFPFLQKYILDPDDPYNFMGKAETKHSCDVSDFWTCGGVDKSKYSEVAGIPVSALGFAGYAAILLLSLAAVFGIGPAKWLLFAGGAAGFSYTVYLNVIELFVLKMMCPHCTVSAGIMVVVFALSIAGLLMKDKPAAATASG